MSDMNAPEGDGVQGIPEQPPAEAATPPGPAPAAKPGTNIPLFLVGLCAPVAVALLLAWGAGAAMSTFWSIAMSIAFPGALSILFVASLVVFLNKRKTGGMLWSLAKGVMWSYIAIALLMLVAFGSCMIGFPSA